MKMHDTNVKKRKIALILFTTGTQFISAVRSGIFFYLLEAFISVCLSVIFFWNCLCSRDQTKLQPPLLLHYFPCHCAVNLLILASCVSYSF